jgi:hypothetical protein
MANLNDKYQKFDRTLTEGPILKAVWKLAWPTMLQNIIVSLRLAHRLSRHCDESRRRFLAAFHRLVAAKRRRAGC